METLKRRSFFGSLFGGAAATAVAVAPAKSEVRDIDGQMALAELSPGREYLLFVDPTRVDIDALASGEAYQGINAPVQIISSLARPGHSVADNVALYALDKPSVTVDGPTTQDCAAAYEQYCRKLEAGMGRVLGG